MMNWIVGILEGCKIFALYIFPIFLPAAILPMLLTKKYNLIKLLLQGTFLLYLCCVIGLVFFPLPTAAQAQGLTYHAILVPLHFVMDILERPVMGALPVLLNVFMFVPFGIYLRYRFRLSARKVFLFSLAFSVLIEFGQYTGLFFLFKGSYRLFEVDDLITNTLGAMIGFRSMRMVEDLLPSLESFDRFSRKCYNQHGSLTKTMIP